MADAVIQIPLDATGKKVDTTELAVGANNVERQRVNISSPSDANGHAEVKNVQPLTGDYGLLVRQVPDALSKYHAVFAGGTNAANIKAAAAQVRLIRAFNNAAYPIHIKLHNTAVLPVPGTTAVVETISLQAGMPYFGLIEAGDSFTAGLGISVVKGIADNDATPVLLNDGVVDVFYV